MTNCNQTSNFRVDIVAVKKEGNQERPVFFIYNSENGKFSQEEVTGVHYENALINNIIVNDFNDDNKVDMMINIQYANKNVTQILFYDHSTSIFKKAYEFDENVVNIMIGDFTEKRGIDFLFYDDKLKSRRILSFDENSLPYVRSFGDIISKDLTICDRSTMHSTLKFSTPHSSAFVDIDGDCLNDILIKSIDDGDDINTNKTVNKIYLEIWRGVIEDNQIKYCLSQSSVYILDPSLGSFSLADIDRDALMDLIFPILDSTPPQILIAYNKINLNYDWTADYCSSRNLYVTMNGDNTFQLTNRKIEIPLVYEELRRENTNSKYVDVITLTHLTSQTFYNNEKFPPYLRFGDINMDSYPDFTVILYDKTDFSQNCYVFLNALSEKPNSGKKIRTFSYPNTYINNLINNAIYSSFFDLDEDGKLDILITYQETNNVINTAGFFNTHLYDAYYLKNIVLNHRDTLFQYEMGANFRFITTDIDGNRRMDVSSQATQGSVTMNLNLPYGYVGIGRSNNYLENFHVISGKYVKVFFFLYSSLLKIIKYLLPSSQIRK
jgi:integrin alpha FG-GAP repeat containing protein 1